MKCNNVSFFVNQQYRGKIGTNWIMNSSFLSACLRTGQLEGCHKNIFVIIWRLIFLHRVRKESKYPIEYYISLLHFTAWKNFKILDISIEVVCWIFKKSLSSFIFHTVETLEIPDLMTVCQRTCPLGRKWVLEVAPAKSYTFNKCSLLQFIQILNSDLPENSTSHSWGGDENSV